MKEMILCISSKLCITTDNRVLHRRFKTQNPGCIWGRDKMAKVIREIALLDDNQD